MMPQEYNIIISDTSCLILLAKIEELELLKKMSHNVYVTKEINEEFARKLPPWILIKDVIDKHYQKIIEIDLDKGEASAIALSLEVEDSILIIDDLKGRKYAGKLGLKFSGTLGLILKAKQLDVIASIKPILNKIKNTNFRFSNALIQSLLEEANES